MIVQFKGVVYQLANGLWQYRVFTHEPSDDELRDLPYDLKFGYGTEAMAKDAMSHAVKTTAENHGCTLEGIDFIESRTVTK